MELYFNPLDLRCKSVIGGIRQNEELILHIYGNNSEPCLLVLQKDGCEAQCLRMQKVPDGWMIQFNLCDCGLYFYHFQIEGKRAACGEERNLIFSETASNYQLLVYDKNFKTPSWFKGGIMYQIFPDRFFRYGNVSVEKGKWLHKNWDEQPEYRMNENGKILNNDFFGGNLQGIVKKLDYLQSLNVSVIYLNPVFKAYSNHRYDTGDYLQIDPTLGTIQDFSDFITQCNNRGIKVILDGVFNHTGDDSRYFNKYGKYDEVGAYQDTKSKYYEWYNFKKFPDLYDCWWGIEILPAVNELCKSYIDFITGKDGVLRYWMKMGVSGFRLDVADELPDEFIKKIREAIKQENQDGILIGEVWEDASNKISYGKRKGYFYGNELDTVMNYPLKDAIIQFVISNDTKIFRQTVNMLLDHYPKCVLDSLMNIIGTHDTGRILTVLGGKHVCTKEEMSKTFLPKDLREIATERLCCAATILFTIFGVPCIYYGDEIGMEGYTDPFCRAPFSWSNIDNRLFSFYQRLSVIRHNLKVLKEGVYNELYADKNCLVYQRKNETELIIVYINRGENKYDLIFNGVLYDLINNTKHENGYLISPHSYSILSSILI